MKSLRKQMTISLVSIALPAIIFVASLQTALQVAWAGADEYRLTILHTNDIHSHFLPFSKLGSACSPDEAAGARCLGGAARLAYKIKEIRAEGGNLVLLDAGDQFQGTLFYTMYKGAVSQKLMNELHYDAMAVGNHEFDNGPCNLAEFIRGDRFPVLSANIDASKEPCLSGLIKSYTIIDCGPEKVGVIGYTTEDLPGLSSTGPNISVAGIEDALTVAVGALRKAGVNKIIALSHAGIGRDRLVAGRVEGIDVIVGGHTHTFLSNTDPGAEGPYPVVTQSPSGAPVLIVSDGYWGKYLGRLNVTFDSAGVPVRWDGNAIALDGSVPEDPAVAEEVDGFEEPLRKLRNEVIGSSSAELVGDGSTCRFEECTMGDAIADAMLLATSSQGARIAFENGGGVRSSIPAGSISVGQILEVLPFGNTISTFDIKGSDILEALELGVSRAESRENEDTGRFLQISGLRYTWNPRLPAGSRIVKAEVRGANGSYEPIQPDAIYRAATNNFLRRGGDGYTVFAEKAMNAYDFGPTLDEALAAYVKARSPLAPKAEGRIVRE